MRIGCQTSCIQLDNAEDGRRITLNSSAVVTRLLTKEHGAIVVATSCIQIRQVGAVR